MKIYRLILLLFLFSISVIANALDVSAHQLPPDTIRLRLDSLQVKQGDVIIINDSIIMHVDTILPSLEKIGESVGFFKTLDYQWISYRMKVTMKQEDKSRLFQLFFVNRIDSIIYLNLSLSGIEIARAVFSPDKLTYVNKLDFTYYQGDYTFIKHFLGVDITFDMLQALFNATDFKEFEDHFTRVEYENSLQLISEKRCHNSGNPCLWQEAWFDNQNHLYKNSFSILSSNQSLIVYYNQYLPLVDRAFFNALKIELPSAGIEIQADVKNVKLNVPGPTGIKIPDHFKPLNMPVKP